MLQWNEAFRMKTKILRMWELAKFLRVMWSQWSCDEKEGSSQHMQLLEALDEWEKQNGKLQRDPREDRIPTTLRLLLLQSGFRTLFASLRFVPWSLLTEEIHCSFCFTKGLNIRKTEAAYPRLMYHTAAFVLKPLCHSEGVLCSPAESWALQWLDSFSRITHCLLYLLMAGFAWQHALSCWETWQTQKHWLLFLQNVWSLWMQSIFWTSEICFCLHCYAHLFGNLEVSRLFKQHVCE